MRKDHALSLNAQKTKYRALHDWFNTPQGLHVGESFTSYLARMPAMFHGNTLLQLGDCGENPWFPVLNFRRKWIASPCLDASHASVVTALNSLPMDRNSVDSVLAPLALEAFGWDKNPLDEMDRILKPMGYVILFGINPCSLWGLAQRFGYLSCLGGRPAALISPLFLQQSLLRRGYRQCLFESFYYLPPLRGAEWLTRLAFLNEMGKIIAVSPAGFYCLIMQKYQKCARSPLRRAHVRRNVILSPEPAWANRQATKLIHPHPN